MRIKATFTVTEAEEKALKAACETREEIEKAFAFILVGLFKKAETIHVFKTIETEVEE